MSFPVVGDRSQRHRRETLARVPSWLAVEVNLPGQLLSSVHQELGMLLCGALCKAVALILNSGVK